MNSDLLEMMISYTSHQISVYHAQGQREIAAFFARQQAHLIAQRSPERVAAMERAMGLA